MAKPKLSTAQKAALREELQKRLKAGEQQSKVLEDLGSKFKVSPETVRYYSKQLALRDGKAARGRAASKRRSPKAAKVGGKKSAKRGTSRLESSKVRLSLTSVISHYDPQELERALKASKLYQELQARRRRMKDLQIELRGSKRAAAKLERQIRRLVRT